MLKHFFLPTKKNNYTSFLLNKNALVIYSIILLIFNYIFSNFSFVVASASIDYSEIYKLHNEEREKQNLPPLTVNTDLIESATNKAKAMLATDCWAHYCPENTSPWAFFDESGYTYVYAGENLAEGFSAADDVMKAWMDSPTHKSNVLNSNFDEIGIGAVTGRFQNISNNTIVVVHFGSRSIERASSINGTEINSLNENTMVRIISPSNDDLLNTNQPLIEGIAPENSQVELSDNATVLLPRINATGINFTYRPPNPLSEGAHQLQATAYMNNSPIGTSNIVNFSIDSIAPEIDENSATIGSLQYSFTNSALLQIKTKSPAEYLIFNIDATDPNKIDDLTWEFKVNLDDIKNNSNIVVSAYDKTGNTNTKEISNISLIQQVEDLKEKFPAPNLAVSVNILSSFGKYFFSKNTKTQFNIVFILFLTCLFILDYYVLHKSGLTGVVKSHSHLHFSIFGILVFILIFSNFSGNILTGIKNL